MSRFTFKENLIFKRMIYPQTLSFLRLVTSKFPSSSKKKKKNPQNFAYEK